MAEEMSYQKIQTLCANLTAILLHYRQLIKEKPEQVCY
jgi:hypothetical protein